MCIFYSVWGNYVFAKFIIKYKKPPASDYVIYIIGRGDSFKGNLTFQETRKPIYDSTPYFANLTEYFDTYLIYI